VDAAVTQARLAQFDPVGAPQVEQPLAGSVRLQNVIRSVRAEVTPRRLGDIVAHLVAVGGDRRADRGDDVRGLAAECGHRLDRRLAHPGDRAAPAGVHAAQHLRDRIVEHDRHAVGHHDHEHDARLGGDQGVRRGDGIVLAERAPAPVGGRDHMHVAAVRLVAEDQVAEVGADGGRGAPPVLEHRRCAVAHVQAEVQRLIWPGGDAAVPAGYQGIDRMLVKGGPGQHVKLAAPSQVRARIRGCHPASLPSRYGCASPAA
jgi:hypothetical protein